MTFLVEDKYQNKSKCNNSRKMKNKRQKKNHQVSASSAIVREQIQLVKSEKEIKETMEKINEHINKLLVIIPQVIHMLRS